MKTASLVLIATLLPVTAVAQTGADSAAVRATAHNYIDGYYGGDGERMGRALHSDLAKRIVRRGSQGEEDVVQHMTATQLIQITARGGGSNTPTGARRNDVEILDIFRNAAVVRIDASDWVDYLQVGKVDGEWLIINVLWEFRPEALERMGQRGR
jgi:hypothetical protein